MAAADEDGYAHFSAVQNLADRARVSLSEAEEAVKTLTAPDPNSANPANEGRRLKRVPGGFVLLNFQAHRELGSRFEQRRQTASRIGENPEAILKSRKGYIYFAQRGSGGNIKIGFSANPWARANELQIGSDEDVVILATIKARASDESKWHKRFQKHCVRGEWFEACEELVGEIEKARATTKSTTIATTLLRPEYACASASDSKAVQTEVIRGPTWDEVLRWLFAAKKNEECDYTEKEAKTAHRTLSVNGWMWGQNPIIDWRAAIETQINRDRDKKVKGNGNGGHSILDMKTVLAAKEQKAKTLRETFAFESPHGWEWMNPEKRAEFVQLRKEIKQLNENIAKAI